MAVADGETQGPWWEDQFTLVSVILGLPVVGLISMAALPMVGVDLTGVRGIGPELFAADLVVRLLSLPIFLLLVRAIVRNRSD